MYAQMILGDDKRVQPRGVLGLRRLVIEVYNTPAFDEVVQKLTDLGVLTKFVEILQDDIKDLNLIYQCTWVIINICCSNSDKVEQIVKLGVLDALLRIIDNVLSLEEVNFVLMDVAHHSVWIIGNIASDNLQHRDICIEMDFPHKIVKLLAKYNLNANLMETGIWALSRLVDLKPAPICKKISEVFPLFISILQLNYTDQKTRKNALWGLYFLSNSFLIDIADSGCIPMLIQYLEIDELSLVFPTLKILGNVISSKQDNLIEEVLKNERFLPRLFDLFSHQNEGVKTYAGWIIGNLAAGNTDHVALLLKEPKYIQTLGNFLQNKDEKSKYLASCAIANLVSHATNEQVEELMNDQRYSDHLSIILKEKYIETYERSIIEPVHKIMKADPALKFTPIFQQKGLAEQMIEISHSFNSSQQSLSDSIFKPYSLEPEPEPAIEPEPEAEPKPEMSSEMEPEIEPESKPELEPELDGELKPETELRMEPEIEPESKPDHETSSISFLATNDDSASLMASRNTTLDSSPQKLVESKPQIKKVFIVLRDKKIQKLNKPQKQLKMHKLKKSMLRATPGLHYKVKAILRRERTIVSKKIRALVRRTLTMEQVIKEAQELIKDVGGRTRKKKGLGIEIQKNADKNLSEEKVDKPKSCLLGASKKIKKFKRTNSIKQTLVEAEKILKQIDVQIQSRRKLILS